MKNFTPTHRIVSLDKLTGTRGEAVDVMVVNDGALGDGMLYAYTLAQFAGIIEDDDDVYTTSGDDWLWLKNGKFFPCWITKL